MSVFHFFYLITYQTWHLLFNQMGDTGEIWDIIAKKVLSNKQIKLQSRLSKTTTMQKQAFGDVFQNSCS